MTEKTASDQDIVTQEAIYPVKKGDPVLSIEDPKSIAKLRFNVWHQTHMHRVERANANVKMSENDLYRVYGIMTTVEEEKRKELKISSIDGASLPPTLFGYKVKSSGGR